MAQGPVGTARTPGRGASRDTLLAAASAIMREGDTIDVSLAEIGRRAGFNTALVSYYFGSKNGLLLALLERNLGYALDQLDGLLRMDLSPSQKMSLHIGGIIRLFFDYPYTQRLTMRVIADCDDAAAGDIADRFLRPMATAHEVIIRDGVAAGEFKPVDPRFFYFLVVGACDQIFSQRSVMRLVHGFELDDETRRQYADQIRATILTGLLA